MSLLFSEDVVLDNAGPRLDAANMFSQTLHITKAYFTGNSK